MDPDRSARMTIRVARSHEEEARMDREFWASMTPEERVRSVWPLTVELWTLKGWDIGEPGSARRVARLVRLSTPNAPPSGC